MSLTHPVYHTFRVYDTVVLTYLPMIARKDGDTLLLEGHIAHANDQWKHEPSSSTALFRIAEHYISPSWYVTKRADPRIVPTYDYVAIEARGAVRFIHDTDWLLRCLRQLTDENEARVQETWSIDHAPRDYLETLTKAIVGVEMRVTTLHGTFKLNQNDPPENIDGFRLALRALGTPQAATLAPFFKDP